MTARELAEDMASYLPPENARLPAAVPFDTSPSTSDPSTSDPWVPVGCTGWMLRTLNAAAREMARLAGAYYKRTFSADFDDATTGTVTATNGSRSITLGTLAVPRMGSTIKLAGDDVYNEIVDVNGSTYELLHPFSGTTGSVSAQNYRDSYVFAASVKDVLGATVLETGRPVAVFASEADFRSAGYVSGDYTTQRYSAVNPGELRAVWLESFFDAAEAASSYRLRCWPLPDRLRRVTIAAEVAADRCVEADLAEGMTFAFAVPGDEQELFRDLVLGHWLKAPWMKTSSARADIQAHYVTAQRAFSAMRPGLGQARTQISGY